MLHDSLGSGETLSAIWERNGRDAEEMTQVVGAVSAVFDVRHLRSGTPVEIFAGSASARGVGPAGLPLRPPYAAPLDSVLIRVDPDRTLAIRAAAPGAAGFVGELRETPVSEVRRAYVGCIEASLYGALVSDGEDFSLLALELDRIYGGVIDFYSDLHPGDCVAMSFRTFVRPDGTFRLGRIESAEFVNRGARHAAIWFEAPDGEGDYYDLDGRSLKRQFLRSPLKFTRISSGFTMRRFHPILKRYRAHPGIDYVAPTGTPVQAAGKGRVAFAGWKRGYGKVVELTHGQVYRTQYAHLSRIPAGVRAGARVSQGDVIGFVGSTGMSTAPHLDYRFSKNGIFVNPLDEALPIGDPVSPEYVTLFAERRDRAMRVLEEAYRTVLVDGTREPAPGAGSLAAASPWLGIADQPAQGPGGFGDD
ncbi:MAG: M23 family metallopeptidase [Gemmatimonadota bacterium]